MDTIWYGIVTFMLAAYVALDGFDFGVGTIYRFTAKSDSERRAALASIGPVWNGNEVWLIASGGILFFAFPKAYAAGFSGFYLALIMVLWLLIFRGLALELRTHRDHPLWRQFWDAAFAASSACLAVVFGVALGNLIRGVPLNQDGYFFVPLWTDFLTGPEPGILDWFTLLMGLTSAVILSWHGTNYLALKCEGALQTRASRLSRSTGWAVGGLSVLVVGAIMAVQPGLRENYSLHPLGYVFPFMGFIAFGGCWLFRLQQQDAGAFVASGLFILAMLASVAWGCYPNLLITTSPQGTSLTIANATAGPYGMRAGIGWFAIGFALIVAYTITIHRAFWGKVRVDGTAH
jgi:cytochrome d ubiquinol oxidase subunit II